MITVQYAKAFPPCGSTQWNPVTPRQASTGTGTQTVEQGAQIIVRMAQVGPDGPTGGYFDTTGPLPW
jgi:hypothetical protein